MAVTTTTVMSEQLLSDCVVELGHVLGWVCAHFRAGRTVHGWATPVSADGAGFVDLVLVKHKVLFVELKSAKGKLTEQQVMWRDALIGAGAEYYVWRPADWASGEIEKVLRS